MRMRRKIYHAKRIPRNMGTVSLTKSIAIVLNRVPPFRYLKNSNIAKGIKIPETAYRVTRAKPP